MANSTTVSAQRPPWIENGAPLYWLALFALVYFAYCLLGTRYSVSYPPVAWPAAGAVLAALGVTRVDRWWRVVLVATSVNFVTVWYFGNGSDAQFALQSSVVRTAEGMFGAWLMKLTVSPPWHRRTSQEILSKMVLAVLVSGGAGALLMLAVDPQKIHSLSTVTERFLYWWLSTFTGAVLFSPILGALILLSNAGYSRIGRIGLVGIFYSVIAILTAAFLVSSVDVFEGLTNTYRVAIAGALLLPIIWFARYVEPIFISCLFLVLAAVALRGLANTTTPLGIAYFGDQAASAGVIIFLAACATAAFTRSINAFEKRHAIKLLAIRQGTGLLVTKVATELSRSLSGDIHVRLESCLQSVGKHAGADRCVIALFDTERQVVSESDSWVRPGIPESEPLSRELPFAMFGGGIETLLAGRSQFARRKDFPKDSIIGKYLARIDTRSAGFVPLRNGSEVIGALGLSWVRHDVTWSNDLIATMRSVGTVIGSAVSRFQSEAIATRYRDKLQKSNDNRHRLDELLRREIATDLHDGAAQSLAVARMKLGQCAASVPASGDSIAEIDKLVTSALDEIRGIIDKTGPTTLYEFGLAAGITDYLRHASDIAGFEIGLTIDCETEFPEEERSAFLFRACRELVTNAIKHSQADEINVILLQDERGFTLRVSDNGKGLSMSHYQPDTAGNTGFGLFSLNEIATSLGGRVEISSSEAGTTVAVDVPTD